MSAVSTATSKVCKKCGEDKSLSDYYRAKGCIDGHRGACIDCSKEWQRTQRDKAAKSESDRRYRKEQGDVLRAKKAAYRKANAEAVRAGVRKSFAKNRAKHYDVQMRKKYGIGEADYQRMLVEQDHACAICLRPETALFRRDDVTKVKRLAIDHCHATGKVRALLCSACNKGIGNLREDPSVLRAAALYVEKHKVD